MKISLILFILMIGFYLPKSCAQGYIPMDTITDWKISSAFFGDPWYYWYTYEGDTIFNGQVYRIIQNHQYEGIIIYHYFREDHIEQKVYKYLPSDDMEIIYYDFSLEIDDEFYVAESDSYFTVYLIDTVYSEIGPLRRWWLERGSLYFTYTEAIGGEVPDYQYWIYVQDPTHDVVCAYHYCVNIFANSVCEPSPGRIDTTEISATECEGVGYELPDGNVTLIPGDYGPFYLSNTEGCDSIVYLNLEFLENNFVFIDTNLCEGDTLNGPLTYSFINQAGCDSIITIVPHFDPLISVEESYELCPGEEVYGISLAGVYTFILPSEMGCDTILTATIIQLPEEDPACITGTDDPLSKQLHIYPNPAVDQLNIETISTGWNLEILDCFVSGVPGKTLLYPGLNSIKIDHLMPGMYILKLTSGNTSVNYKLIKGY